MKQLIDAKTHTLGDVLEAVRREFPDDRSVELAAEVALSVAAALCIHGLEGCPAVLLEGPAAGRKTTALQFFPSDLEVVYFTDSFTPAAFVSHMADKRNEQLEKIDLLPKIRHKVFLVPDLGVMFANKQEKLRENLGVLTRILDGQGYMKDSGAQGRRGYEGDYKFCMLGATTPLAKSAWEQMSNLGSRMLVLDTGGKSATVDELADMLTKEAAYHSKLDSVRRAVRPLLQWLFDPLTGGYGSVRWDMQADEPLALYVARLANLAAQLRGRSDDEEGDLTVQVESPTRLAVALMGLARGHAVASGRTILAQDDIALVARLAFDTCPTRRRRVFRCLLTSPDGTMDTNDATEAGRCSKTTALTTMGTLVALGVAEWTNDAGPASFQSMHQPNSIRLAEEHAWLKAPENKWVLARVQNSVPGRG